jgi:hypothetical protein
MYYNLQGVSSLWSLMLFYFVRHHDHCCFVILSPGAAHSPETTELRDTKYSDICYVVMRLNMKRTFRKTL